MWELMRIKVEVHRSKKQRVPKEQRVRRQHRRLQAQAPRLGFLQPS